MIPVEPNVPIVDEEGRVTQAFQNFLLDVYNGHTRVGTGSPEGLLNGNLGQQYMDDSGATGTVLYIKHKTNISGDNKKGWILV